MVPNIDVYIANIMSASKIEFLNLCTVVSGELANDTKLMSIEYLSA